MSYKPSDFFVGVLDFFGIIMPGAIATYILEPTIVSEAGKLGIKGIDSGTAGWVAFFVGAYVLGHLIFLFGRFLDYLDGPLRKLRPPQNEDRTFLAAKAVRDAALGDAAEAVKPYRFAKAVLQFHHQEALTAVTRVEADSKFFRSLCIVLVLLLLAKGKSLSFGIVLVLIVLCSACFWRYAELRRKATDLACGFLIVHHASEAPSGKVDKIAGQSADED